MNRRDYIAKVWPNWQVVKELGRGSNGVVYEAIRQDFSIQSRSAIKVISVPSSDSELISIRSELSSDAEVEAYIEKIVEDCVKEIRVLESFKGTPGIVNIEDFEVVPNVNGVGRYILIRMELLTPLPQYLLNHSLTEKDVIRLGIDLCSALEFCAKNNVLHRDIKPENIFIHERFGFFKLGDFGIARELENISSALSQRGTFNYMAPEIMRGDKTYDERVDIYSLGLVLYRLMNDNRLPFVGDSGRPTNAQSRTQAALKRMSVEELPVPSRASSQFANIILKACRLNKEDRFQTPGAMKHALENLQVDLELDATVSVRKSDFQQILDTENLNQLLYEQPVSQATHRPIPHLETSLPPLSEQQQQTNIIQPSGKKRRGIVTVLAFVMLVGFGLVYKFLWLDYASLQPVSLSDYSVSLQLEGEDGQGVAQVKLNLIPETSGTRAEVEEFLRNPSVKTSPSNNLSNGDRVEVEIKLDDIEAKRLGLRLEGEFVEYFKVEGLRGADDIENTEQAVDKNKIKSVTATSYLSEPEYDVIHRPENVLDGDKTTAWLEGVEGQGLGESLIIELTEERELTAIHMMPGYQKDDKHFYYNSRPTEIELTFTDGTSQVFELEDEQGVHRLQFPEPVLTSSVKITILKVYSGRDYEDTAISAIELLEMR